MGQAYFRIDDETVEVFGPRAEQVAEQLELADWRDGKALAERISAHIADGQPGEDLLDLDGHECRALLGVVEQMIVASKDEPPQDLVALRGVLQRSVGDG